MKKKVILGSMLSLFCLGAAACGSSGGDSGSNTNDSGGSSDNVTISYASWDTDQAVGLQKVIDKFEADNPNITVKMETTPWEQYWTKLEAATTGGNMPDIITMHLNESYKYMSNGMLMDLQEMVDAGDIDFDNFTDGIADLYSYEDKNYAVPKDVTTIGVWYNKTLFEEAGVPLPTADWTWEDFSAAAAALTNEETGVFGYAATNAPETGYYDWIYQNEGSIFTDDGLASGFSEQNTIDAFQHYVDFTLTDKVSPAMEVLRETDQVNLLGSGKVAMITHGSWMASGFAENEYIAENCDVAVLPQGEVQATVTNGLAWSIAADTEHPEEAKKFMAFLASEEANQIQSDEGVSIPAYKGLGEGWVNKFVDVFPGIGAFDDMLEYGVIRPFNQETLKCESLMDEEVDKALAGTVTVEEASENIVNGVNDIMAAYQ
ncbi:ABC transporter substrate-binding protein [Enterococcus sp. HY326]|uniref:ABC transporter substrate-binding protein n=1 Tax=Enterococcus sp. HY326 TaxID=2971265 RepID=UPI00223F81BE|nr:sugar ABC transporter substrate-binding protein [Enterococcus sp. HY326]